MLHNTLLHCVCLADTFITHQLKEKLDVVDALHQTNLLKHAGLDAQFQQGKACSPAGRLGGSPVASMPTHIHMVCMPSIDTQKPPHWGFPFSKICAWLQLPQVLRHRPR